ncbi:MAG: hypothetical protein JSR18_02350 [Proteobacteria bacterium]|nr:hypothetical protein [Pseudomonadota bacterium]
MKRLALALLSIPLVAFGQTAPPPSPDLWIGAHPAVALSVTPYTTPDLYVVSAVVTDLRNDTVIAKPVMLVKAGAPARLEAGVEGVPNASGFRMQVTVARDGKTAAFKSEVKANGETVAAQAGTLAVL